MENELHLQNFENLPNLTYFYVLNHPNEKRKIKYDFFFNFSTPEKYKQL